MLWIYFGCFVYRPYGFVGLLGVIIWWCWFVAFGIWLWVSVGVRHGLFFSVMLCYDSLVFWFEVVVSVLLLCGLVLGI